MPYTPFDPYASLFGDPPAGAQAITSLPPEERESLLRSLAQAGGSGLSLVGSILDAPGRPIRSALAGRFGDILPSIFDKSRAPSGEDLAKQWGLIHGEGRKGEFEMRDLLGPALEVATNPTTFINPLSPLVGGSLTEAGQAAKLAGKNISAMQSPAFASFFPGQASLGNVTGKLGVGQAERIAAGQGSLFKLGLPFTDAGINIGTGETAQKVADAIGNAYGAIGRSAPGRVAASLFDRSVEGSTDPFLQPVLREGAELGKQRTPDALQSVYSLARQLGPDAQGEVPLYQQQLAAKGLPSDLINSPNDIMRAINEGVITPIQGTKTGAVGQGFSDIASATPALEKAQGLKGFERTGYAPRHINPDLLSDPAVLRLTQGARPQVPFQSSQIERSVPTDELLGKTLGLNKASLDPEVAGALRGGQRSAEDIQETILKKYMGLSDQDLLTYQTLSRTPKQFHQPWIAPIYDSLKAKVQDADKLTDILGNLDPVNVAKKLPFYSEDYFGGWADRLVEGAAKGGRAEAMLNGLRKVAKPAGTIGPDSVPLSDVLEKAGFGESAKSLVDPTLHVPAAVADAVAKYITAFNRPESVSPLIQAYDNFTSLFRVGVSTIFPASRVRDAWQNVFMNWVRGNRDPRYGALNPLSYYQPYEDAAKAFRLGGTIADANEIDAVRKVLGPNVTPEAATKYLADQAAAHGLIRPGEASAAAAAKAGIQMAPGGFSLPGEAKPLLAGVTEGASLKPWDLRGIGGRGESGFIGAKVGGRTIEAIDDLGRGAAYIAQLRKGASFEEAARAATEAMYDYGNLTKFEKSVAQRVIPFYSFMRQNLPAQLEELIKNPGGKLSSAIRATATVRNQQGFVPEQVGEGLALPIGERDETGRQSYLTHFGLPFEEAFSPVAPGSVKQSLQNMFSETHPLIKAPIELATGQSLFTGRPLQTGTLGTLAANSPVSRLMTQGRDLLNAPQHPLSSAMSLAGPFKIRDVNTEQAEKAAARDAIAEMLFGNPNTKTFSQLTVPKANVPNLSERDLQLMRLYKTLNEKKRVGVP